MGPKGGGCIATRGAERPSRIGTAIGARARRYRAIPAARNAIRSERLPMLLRTPGSATSLLSFRSWISWAPRRPFCFRQRTHLVSEDAVAKPHKHLVGAVEHDEGRDGDPADQRRRAGDTTQEWERHTGQERDEEHHPDVVRGALPNFHPQPPVRKAGTLPFRGGRVSGGLALRSAGTSAPRARAAIRFQSTEVRACRRCWRRISRRRGG
jgi:hypothetical protein